MKHLMNWSSNAKRHSMFGELPVQVRKKKRSEKCHKNLSWRGEVATVLLWKQDILIKCTTSKHHLYKIRNRKYCFHLCYQQPIQSSFTEPRILVQCAFRWQFRLRTFRKPHQRIENCSISAVLNLGVITGVQGFISPWEIGECTLIWRRWVSLPFWWFVNITICIIEGRVMQYDVMVIYML